MSQTNETTAFRIEWDLRELGPKPEATAAADAAPTSPYRDISARLDFSRLDLGRAVAAGYAPANVPRPQKRAA